MSAVVRARGLGKQYRRRWALQDCTLEIPVGRVTGLVGPNGAGKTTLLSLMVGLLTPTVGTIEVCGGRPAADSSAAGQGRLRRAGHPDVRRAHGRRPSAPGCTPQPAVGRRGRATPDRPPRPRSASEGRPALRRPACPARADARTGEAARAADPRRAGREPGPAGPTRVPAGADGGGRRGRDQRAALLARRVRPRTGLRPRRRPGRLAGPGRRRRRASCSPRTTGCPGRFASPPPCRPTSTSSGPATPIVSPPTSYAPSRRSSIRPGPSPHWVWKTSCWPTWKAPRPSRRPARHWRCSGDLADLAAVPHPVHRGLRARRWRPVSGSPSPARRSLVSPAATRTSTTSSPATIGCSSTAASPSSRWRLRSSGSSGAHRWWPESSRPAPIGSPGTSRSPAAAGSRRSSASRCSPPRWRSGSSPPRSPGGRTRSTARPAAQHGSLASRLTPISFAMRGIVPIGYAVFALLLGTLIGLILRRSVPAMAADPGDLRRRPGRCTAVGPPAPGPARTTTTSVISLRHPRRHRHRRAQARSRSPPTSPRATGSSPTRRSTLKVDPTALPSWFGACLPPPPGPGQPDRQGDGEAGRRGPWMPAWPGSPTRATGNASSTSRTTTSGPCSGQRPVSTSPPQPCSPGSPSGGRAAGCPDEDDSIVRRSCSRSHRPAPPRPQVLDGHLD